MIRREFILVITLLISFKLFAGEGKPFGWFHTKNQKINGVSVGIYSDKLNTRNVITNGCRFELLGIGLYNFFAWGYINFENEIAPLEPFSEKVNGINFSTLGTISNLDINGLGINGIGCYLNKVHGVLFSTISNNTKKGSGVFIAGLANYNYDFKGVSFSTALNSVYNGKGVQIALISNRGKNYNGIQVSCVNIIKSGRCIQVGAINYIKENPIWCRVLPIINMRFEN